MEKGTEISTFGLRSPLDMLNLLLWVSVCFTSSPVLPCDPLADSLPANRGSPLSSDAQFPQIIRCLLRIARKAPTDRPRCQRRCKMRGGGGVGEVHSETSTKNLDPELLQQWFDFHTPSGMGS